MKFNKQTLKKEELNFETSVSTVDYNWDLPILVSDSKEVYAGNSFRDNLKDDVVCVVIPKDDYLKACLVEIEKEISLENDKERYDLMHKEVKKYLELWEPKVEEFSLFTDEEIKDDTLITEENYIDPPIKHDLHDILSRRR